jgi:dihydrofolate synthase / folylpolyglutamate synthase
VTNSSQRIIDRIHESTAHRGPLGLDRMRRLLSLLGNPEKKLRIFHVAGTNGKGSVCTYLASMLQEAGYRVGVFTSPHVMLYNERFALNQHLISDAAFVHYGTSVLSYNEWLNQEGYGYLSEFEILTAIAYLFFADREVDYMISEVGIGGGMDSTNTIENPVSTIITQVGLDHTAMLGNTLQEIAWNKSGIIKPGVPIISESAEPEVRNYLAWKAKQKDAPYIDVSETPYEVISFYPNVTFHAEIGGVRYENLCLSMQGEHQIRNAITAMTAVLAAKAEGKIRITDDAIRQGLRKARIMGRFEFLREENPTVIIDGGHNPNGVRAAVTALKQYLEYRAEDVRTLVVFGCFKDKEYDQMVAELAALPADTQFMTTEPCSERALDAGILAGRLMEKGFHAIAITDEKDAYEAAVNGCYDVVLFVGSIYLIGDVRILYQTKGW